MMRNHLGARSPSSRYPPANVSCQSVSGQTNACKGMERGSAERTLEGLLDFESGQGEGEKLMRFDLVQSEFCVPCVILHARSIFHRESVCWSTMS
jgi:hypothetical protein